MAEFEAELLVAEVDLAGLDPDMDERFIAYPDTVGPPPASGSTARCRSGQATAEWR